MCRDNKYAITSTLNVRCGESWSTYVAKKWWDIYNVVWSLLTCYLQSSLPFKFACQHLIHDIQSVSQTPFSVYRIIMGTLDQDGAADVEFVLRPYMNTARKRRFLSEEDPWWILNSWLIWLHPVPVQLIDKINKTALLSLEEAWWMVTAGSSVCWQDYWLIGWLAN